MGPVFGQEAWDGANSSSGSSGKGNSVTTKKHLPCFLMAILLTPNIHDPNTHDPNMTFRSTFPEYGFNGAPLNSSVSHDAPQHRQQGELAECYGLSMAYRTSPVTSLCSLEQGLSYHPVTASSKHPTTAAKPVSLTSLRLVQNR